jgi:uncharacterized cupredoxin-like copper-binding protein
MTLPRFRTLLLVALLAAASLALIGCGDDDDDDDGAATATSTSTADGGGGGEGSTVNVALAEWSVTPDPASVSAGEVTFAVSNDGSVPHELVVIKSDLAPDALPIAEGVVDESQVEFIGEVEQFDAGTTDTGTFSLEPGNYVLICNVTGHYSLGMHTAFTVQ